MNKALLTAAAPLAIAMAACGGGHREPSPAENAAAAAPAAEAGAAASQPGYFTVPSDQLAHLQVGPVHKSVFATSLQLTGTVDWDNNHTTQAITQVSGPIARILVDAGAQVTANQPLLYVASPDITGAIASYRKAKNRLDLARHNLDRNKDLLEHKAISQRDYEAVQADYNDAETDVEMALQALHIFGVASKDLQEAERQNVPIRPELPMRSPIAGTVVQRLVSPGQVIQAGTTVAFVVSNVSTVWVQGHVYEKDLRLVRVGDKADVQSPSFPDTFEGTVTYVGDMLDPATRTTPIRIVTKNPRAFLKKDQFVNITLHDKSTHESLVVPTSAVLYDDENMPFVYVQVEPGKFAQRQVRVGPQHDDVTEVTGGLKEGEPVVSQGSVFLQFANTYRG
jgi:cobalt-zinc-cadmium efflux system membrane fusion protein